VDAKIFCEQLNLPELPFTFFCTKQCINAQLSSQIADLRLLLWAWDPTKLTQGIHSYKALLLFYSICS